MQPVNNKLYFAGEHLYHQHIGTAYGAHCTRSICCTENFKNFKWKNN
jgi:hypothetical protein